MWPFKKINPFVMKIAESLHDNPDVWTMMDSEVITGSVYCDEDHPDAIRGLGIRKDYTGVAKTYTSNGVFVHPWYYRPVTSHVFVLQLKDKEIRLVNPDASTEEGWVIERPPQIKLTKKDIKFLSAAVKQWRVYKHVQVLHKQTPEADALAEAFKELEEHLEGEEDDYDC
jgi:hypothetical protein